MRKPRLVGERDRRLASGEAHRRACGPPGDPPGEPLHPAGLHGVCSRQRAAHRTFWSLSGLRASRSTVHVSTLPVVSCPATSMDSRSSRSCTLLTSSREAMRKRSTAAGGGGRVARAPGRRAVARSGGRPGMQAARSTLCCGHGTRIGGQEQRQPPARGVAVVGGPPGPPSGHHPSAPHHMILTRGVAVVDVALLERGRLLLRLHHAPALRNQLLRRLPALARRRAR